ncbi:MAG: hydrogenase expression/formation protein [Caulobacterales bacterium]|nr:hydrogenase expression/formation protein [Caulobacterales bacterium]
MGEAASNGADRDEAAPVLSELATTPVARDEANFMAARASDPLAALEESALADAAPALRLGRDIAQALSELGHGAPQTVFDVGALDADNRRILGEILGEGEVSILVHAPVQAQIQESVLAGVWRVRETGPDGRVVRDTVEIGEAPAVVRTAAFEHTATAFDAGAPPEGAMNVLPVLAEIADRAARYEPGAPNHVISFSLLPMTPEDQTHLQAVLGRGPVHMVSRGYGRCRVLATGVRRVWAVQFFSAMDDVILDTIEIGDVPSAARAAKEDFEDSAERLAEIVEAYL